MDRAGAARPTIVCVDDDTLVLRSLREQLQRGLGAACDIELAAGAAEALELLGELAAEGADVPLMISDQTMPGMKGAQLLAEAHRRYPAMLKVLLTGQADAEAVAQAVNEANLYRLLHKPWQEHDLVLTVREALRRVEQDRALAARTAALEAANRQLEQSMQLLHATMDATLDAILVIDRHGALGQFNRPFAELWQVPPALARPGAPAAAIVGHMRARLREPGALALDAPAAPQPPAVLELDCGRVVEYLCRPHQVGGQRVGTVCCFRDVTERHRSAALVQRQAFHDAVTGLANRHSFDDALRQAVEGARRAGRDLAVLFIDLDRFKRVNDTLGHEVGDELLKLVAQRLCGCVRERDRVARWGGDEFTVLLDGGCTPHEAAEVARRILASLASPLQLGAHRVHAGASIGYAMFPEDGPDAPTLLRHADLALYQVKADGRNGFRRYRRGHGADALPRLALEADLHRAVEHGELELHYQPQVDTRCGRITHVEALARWRHPRLGWIAPGTFIPMLEETGLIVPFGAWVLQAACGQLARWHARGLADLHIAVNVSAFQIERADLLGTVRQALSRCNVPADRLELEVTEAVALRSPERTAGVLRALRDEGVHIALDDFGTGYASLSYLKQLPCQTLKIDRSFVAELPADRRNAAIVSAVVALGEALELRVIAEGVETAAVQALLQQLGCWTMQGHLFSAALPAEALAEWIGRGGLRAA